MRLARSGFFRGLATDLLNIRLQAAPAVKADRSLPLTPVRAAFSRNL